MGGNKWVEFWLPFNNTLVFSFTYIQIMSAKSSNHAQHKRNRSRDYLKIKQNSGGQQ